MCHDSYIPTVHGKEDRICQSTTPAKVRCSSSVTLTSEGRLSLPGVLEISCPHRLIPASDGLETSKEEGECRMPGKGTHGCNSLAPRCQCQSYMVKAALPASQSKGVLELQRRKESWKAVSEKMVKVVEGSTMPAFRATHSLVGFTDERDT